MEGAELGPANGAKPPTRKVETGARSLTLHRRQENAWPPVVVKMYHHSTAALSHSISSENTLVYDSPLSKMCRPLWLLNASDIDDNGSSTTASTPNVASAPVQT